MDFVLKKKQNSVRPIFATAKTHHTEFAVFSTSKLQVYNKLLFAKCRTFQAVPYDTVLDKSLRLPLTLLNLLMK